MSLTKCKECGEQISTKAESCPKCGAKVPKKTSPFTWVVLIFIVLIAIGRLSSNSSESTERTGTAAVGAVSKSGAISATPQRWDTSVDVDKMSGKANYFISSPRVQSTDPMIAPYTDVMSWIGYGCDSDSEWLYFGFSTDPNLTNTETHSGYNGISTRVKWGDQVQTELLEQKWGDRFLTFANSDQAIEKLLGVKTVLLELDWYGQNPVYFRYSAEGAHDALKWARSKCHKAGA